MAAAKMETASEEYARRKAERAAKEQLFDFTSPSGMKWKLRKPNLAQFVASGMMPMSLAAKMAEREGSEGISFGSLNVEDQIRTIEFMGKVVRYVTVQPKVVDKATSPNEITFEDLEMDDSMAILAWAMPGGEEAEGLGNFRSEG